MVEDLCNENVLQMDASSDHEVDHVAQGEAGQCSGAAAPPPPYGGVAEHFCELEDTAEKCGMSEVSYHLRKAKLAWMSAFGERETKQTCMRDYMETVRLTGRKECVCFLHLRRFVARAMFS